MTGIAVEETSTPKETEGPPKNAQVIRDLALDLQQTLTRKGRAPFILSGLPMFADLSAIQQTLEQCLAIREDPHFRCWHTVLAETLPQFQSSFDEVAQAVHWMDDIKNILDAPFPTDDDPAPGSDEVARQLAHHLGSLADLSDLTPWLTAFRQDLSSAANDIGLVCFIATKSSDYQPPITPWRVYTVKPSAN